MKIEWDGEKFTPVDAINLMRHIPGVEADNTREGQHIPASSVAGWMLVNCPDCGNEKPHVFKIGEPSTHKC